MPVRLVSQGLETRIALSCVAAEDGAGVYVVQLKKPSPSLYRANVLRNVFRPWPSVQRKLPVAKHSDSGKPKGRPPGLPNLDRRKFFEELREHMYLSYNKPDYDPVIELAVLAHLTKDDSVKAHCLGQVARFVRPTLKSVEVTTDPASKEELEHRLALLGQLDEAIGIIVTEKRAAAEAKLAGSEKKTPKGGNGSKA